MDKEEKKVDYNEVYESIVSLLEAYSDILDTDTYSAVTHYLEHGEYEMAYEGLFIDLIDAKFEIQKIDIKYYLTLGVKLNLDKESVFKGDFWKCLTNYIHKQESGNASN